MSACPTPQPNKLDACCKATLERLDTIITNTENIQVDTEDLEALVTITNTILTSIDAGIPATLGQTTMANSMPVVIASDQTPLPVTLVSSSGVLKYQYNEVLSVAAAILTTITTYVAVLNDYIQSSTFSGTNIAEYTILVNAVIIMKKRTEFTSLNDTFVFTQDMNGYKLNVGDMVTIKVIHNRPFVGDFNNTLQILNI